MPVFRTCLLVMKISREGFKWPAKMPVNIYVMQEEQDQSREQVYITAMFHLLHKDRIRDPNLTYY